MHEHISVLNHFVSFAAKELKLTSLPNIRFVGHEEDGKQAFGHAKGSDIVIRVKGRHPVDVMRTIAHELVHVKQGIKVHGEQNREDSANALAGRIMRKYGTAYPRIFKLKPISEEMVTNTPANAMGASSPYNPSSPIAQPETILKAMTRRKAPTDLRSITGQGALLKDLRRDKKRGV